MFQAPAQVFRTVEERFGGRRVLVVGDLMLDVYLHGDVSRISPEAPVPVVRLRRRSEVAGGSGNVLLNLVGLGLETQAVGLIGDDAAGTRLRRRLEDVGVSIEGLVTVPGGITTTKTRVVSGQHQLIRLDEEAADAVDTSLAAHLIDAVRDALDQGVAAVILSDYAKGVLSAEVCRAVIEEARRRGVPVLVDPKDRSFAKYAGATTLTPNLREFEMVTGLTTPDGPEFASAGERLRQELNLDFLVVTCGDKGISYFHQEGLAHHPALAREVFDVSGAGDTVLATLAAGLVAGLGLDDAIRLANLAAGVVVGKAGTTPIARNELLDAIRGEPFTGASTKVLALEDLTRLVNEWRARGDRVVFTNGCFDLLHVGHVTLLANARREGTRLIVGLNTDRSVRALKGPSRPVVNQDDRAHVLAGLTSVDAVVLFDEDTPLRLIEQLQPDVLVKGGDYREAEVVGADLVKTWGGRVAIIPLVEGRSTTRMIAQAGR